MFWLNPSLDGDPVGSAQVTGEIHALINTTAMSYRIPVMRMSFNLTTDANGSTGAGTMIRDAVPYCVQAKAEYGSMSAWGSSCVNVTNPRELQVIVATDKRVYLPNESITVHGQVMFANGTPVQEAMLELASITLVEGDALQL